MSCFFCRALIAAGALLIAVCVPFRVLGCIAGTLMIVLGVLCQKGWFRRW